MQSLTSELNDFGNAFQLERGILQSPGPVQLESLPRDTSDSFNEFPVINIP